MRRRLRWRRPAAGEAETIAARLADWPAPAGGAVRHMFPLSVLEAHGVEPMRVAGDEQGWAAAVVFPGRVLVPCGDPEVLWQVGPPIRRWRLLVGDRDAGDAVLAQMGDDPELIVHDQRFLVVDRAKVPAAAELADPGLRRAQAEDVPRLAELAVQLHVDDRFGPHPGKTGLRGYRERLEQTVRHGQVWCVGPVGDPVCKLERSVSSARWGVQLAGIVVDPTQRSRGLGRAAVAAAVRDALREDASRPVSLHVRGDNAAAIRAYEAVGFRDLEAWRLAVRP